MKNVVLLVGARNNCGDHLIVDRAKRLFSHFLPDAKLSLIDRTRPLAETDIQSLEVADLAVLVGGPLIRNDCAEALHLDKIALSGRLTAMKTPFVIMGGGSKPIEPFTLAKIRPTRATRILFDKLESSPYYSGTRDYESLIALRNAGFSNYRFTGCPALFAPPEQGRRLRPSSWEDVRRVVFSAGAPGTLSSSAVDQHLGVLDVLRSLFPAAELVMAAHHTVNEEIYAGVYGKPMPNGWSRLVAEAAARNVCTIDISGGLETMESLYSAADLHIGYRVHAHVLMTSWHKPSVLIAEDGRASGMADVIDGPVLAAWRSVRYAPGFLGRIFGASVRKERVYDLGLTANLASKLSELLRRDRLPNQLKCSDVRQLMERWFGQFNGENDIIWPE